MNIPPHIKRKVLLLAVIGLLGAVFFWFATHGSVEITLDVPSPAATYTLTDPSSQKQIQLSGTSVAKKTLKTGQYEVSVSGEETSYFAIIKVSGFLRKTSVLAKLSPEKSRRFIGDNPASCMYYLGQTLASVDCGDLYSQLQLHLPATSKQPTYKQKARGNVDGTIEGITNTPQGTFILLQPSGGGHMIYSINDMLGLANGKTLSTLNADKSYSMLAYKNGFIVYDGSFSEIIYYASVDADPTAITIPSPQDKKLVPYALKTQGSNIMLAYSSDTSQDVAIGGDDRKTSNKPPKKVTTTIIVSTNDKTREFSFKKKISNFVLCGSNKLCLLNDKLLEVYDIASTEPQFKFSVSEVDSIEPLGTNILLAKSSGLIGLNVDIQEGSLQYSFGDYSYCGITASAVGYILCVADQDKKSAALLIDPTIPNTSSIDKKIDNLRQRAIIREVSVYGSFIYISPDVGEPAFIESLGIFGYDPELMRSAKQEIDQIVNEAGIDRSIYTVVNILE